MKFRLRSSAKVNLTLDILGVLPNGYHTLSSIVHTVGIWDEIDATLTPNTPVTFSCNRDDLTGEDNLCIKTIYAWNKATNTTVGGKIHLNKKIPTGAGLGGGSGNAAAILIALNKMRLLPLSDGELNDIGASLGADVPLFIKGGGVLMEGIGEKLTPLPKLEGALLVVKPVASLSTPQVYKAYDHGGFSTENATPAMLATFESPHLNVRTVVADLGNDLEKAAAQITSAPAKIVEYLWKVNALGAQMSGSGSACFGIFESQEAAEIAHRDIQSLLAKDLLTSGSQCFVAAFCEKGVELL
jgi:4-diphosphocytidyl-2-C-methyl-D-erythritol kinase